MAVASVLALLAAVPATALAPVAAPPRAAASTAAAASAASAEPRAAAGLLRAVRIGIGDQKPDMFGDPRFMALGITHARLAISWDAMTCSGRSRSSATGSKRRAPPASRR